MGPLEQVRTLAARVAASYGLEIFDVELRREGRTQVLRVFLDKPGPSASAADSVSLDECARVSEELSALLDVEEVVPVDSYTLEVSSPGLDRPLRGIADYRRFTGRRAKVVLSAPIDRQTAFVGHLRGVDGDEVLFESEGGRLVRMPMGQIARARLDVEF
ncbi:MAG: ribosome maturation factor RimP [Acidobacteria bacterium]|nr:ribosome maturation factor RimP [Acidobacteriota bacterium]